LALWVAQWGLLIVGVIALAVVLTAGTETHHGGNAQRHDETDSIGSEPMQPAGAAPSGPSRIG
jgi:predicted anti-sigma-YlaC factor YlaD